MKAGKVLPPNRARALRLYLNDRDAFDAFVMNGPARVDLKAQGVAGDHRGIGTAYEQLTAMVNEKLKDDKSKKRSEALREVARENPEMWRQYRRELETVAE